MGGAGGDKILQCLKDYGDTTLVVRTQESPPIGKDQIFTQEAVQLRKVFGVHHHAQLPVDYQLAAVVVEDLRVDILARQIWGGVHMGQQADDGESAASGGGRKGGIYIAMLIHMGVGESQLPQFIH